MRFFNFDPFAHNTPADLTVGALRAKATNVDVTPKSFGGAAPLGPNEKARTVTSGDIMAMFARHAEAV